MSQRDGDTFYPHHPDTVPAGDYCVNTRYDTGGDVFYLVVDAQTPQQIAWGILNSIGNLTSWHIHPAIIPFIAQFIVSFIDKSFTLNEVSHDFKVLPIQKNFTVTSVIEDNVSMKPSDLTTSFKLVPIQHSFTLLNNVQTNFKITRVFDNTRSEI
jgi:hypothetical protein